MHDMDVPMDYHVRYCAKTLPKTHAKAGQCNAEKKTILSTIQNDLFHGFIDKAIVSFCNRFQSCVGATGGHGH